MSHSRERAAVFDCWMQEHRGIIEKIVRSFTTTTFDAADLRQEMLLQLWISLGAFNNRSKPSTWIYRVCLNTALTWRRSTSRRAAHHAPGHEADELPHDSPLPSDRVADGDLLQQLYSAIHTMPLFERALVLLALEGLSYREIAEITGLTENHVGVSLARARQRLAAKMKGVAHELE